MKLIAAVVLAVLTSAGAMPAPTAPSPGKQPPDTVTITLVRWPFT